MRRTYISPEYSHMKVYGTFNMREESNFFSGKMLDIEDSISISTTDITYYQNNKGEQLDFSIESSSAPMFYSPVQDKKNNHKLVLDENQTEFQKTTNTKWLLTIDLKTTLINFVFATMKKYRTFEGVRNDITQENDVNVALKKYIELNVYDRYKLESIDLFLNYKELRNQTLYRYKNNWTHDVAESKYKFTKIQTEVAIDGSEIRLYFTQEKPSAMWVYDYFFNLNFVKA